MKIIIILPYFGKFKCYFDLFIKSCISNENVNWLIITDNDIRIEADNIEIINMTFEEFKKLAFSKMPFVAKLSTPYKLCDYKPAYGLIFQEYITAYDYWGYCDCDMIFGKLGLFLNPLMEKGYDKIFVAGHLTVYKNTIENNQRFIGTAEENQLVYGTEKTLGFDEPYFDRRNIHSIFLESEATVYEEDYSANPAVRHDKFVLTKYNATTRTFEEENYTKTFYYWCDGHVIGLTVEHDQLVKREFVYIHFQNRNMHIDKKETDEFKMFYMVPNKFVNLEKVPSSPEELREFDLEPKNDHYKELRIQKIRHKVKRLKELLGM